MVMLSRVCTISVKFYFLDNLYWIVRLTVFLVLTINRLSLLILKKNRFLNGYVTIQICDSFISLVVFQFFKFYYILRNVYKFIRFVSTFPFDGLRILYIFLYIFNSTQNFSSVAKIRLND